MRTGVTVLAALLLAGCGGPEGPRFDPGGGRAEVTGTVTFQGKPLHPCQVTIMADGSSNQGMAYTDAAGRYAIKDAPTGPVTVLVDTTIGRDMGVPYTPIPLKYARFRESPVRQTVGGDGGTVDVDVQPE